MRGKEIRNWRKLPFCILGYVKGPVRWEKAGGGDHYFGEDEFFFWHKPWGEYGLVHIQYQSRFGFLLMWPLAIYFWIQFKKGTPNTIPHDEVVLNGRAGARFEAGRGLYIWPSFYLGLHWD